MRIGLVLSAWRGSDGIGANVLSAAAQSGAITTTQDNSAIELIIVDWAATDVTSRTWPNVNGAQPTEVTVGTDGGVYTWAVAYYADAGAAGSKTVGLSTPTLGTPDIIAVEIKGTTGGGGEVVDDSQSDYVPLDQASEPRTVGVW